MVKHAFSGCLGINVLPWQQTLWQRFLKLHESQHLPHALLLTGAQGMGQEQFALAMAKHLLLANAESISTTDEFVHPDFFIVEPEESKKTIAVDQIRQLSAKLQQTSTHYSVAIIKPADSMHIAASNALLKTLEEPPANTLLILISSRPQRLLATIRSRCQRWTFALPDREMAITWLKSQLEPDDPAPQWLLHLANQGPLSALAIVEEQALRKLILMDLMKLAAQQIDCVSVVQAWLKYDSERVLHYLRVYLFDILRLHQEIVLNDVHPNYAAALQKIVVYFNAELLFSLLHQLNDLSRDLKQNQLNAQYQLQAILSRL